MVAIDCWSEGAQAMGGEEVGKQRKGPLWPCRVCRFGAIIFHP